MPGFNISSNDGGNPNARSELRRVHRWRMRAGFFNSSEWAYLKKAQRPNFTLEEAEMHHDQEQVYFAGKQTWETVTVEFYDAQNDPDISKRVYDWLVGSGNSPLAALTAATPGVTVNTPSDYKRTTLELVMIDGKGNSTEAWHLYNAWPSKVNWMDVDYTNNEIIGVEITIRFDRAVRS